MRGHILSILLVITGAYLSTSVTGFEIPEGFTTPEGFSLHNWTELLGDDFSTKTSEVATDIPQADIDDALNLDVGKYSTISFHYFNHQNDYDTPSRPSMGRCFDDHLKCLLTQTQEAPVCAFHDHTQDGYHTLPSYCHVYLDNCRRGVKYWIIYRLGPCQWRDMNNYCVDFIQSGGYC